MNPNQPTSTCFPALAALLSQQPGPDSALSPSAKSSPTVRKSSKRGSGRLMPTLQSRDYFPAHKPEYVAEKKAQGHGMANLNDFLNSTETLDSSTAPDTMEPACSQQAFHVSPQVAPGSEEAARMTAGSGRRLYESLVKHSRLGQSSKILLESLLSNSEWSSRICFLKWRASATKSSHRLLFQLVPSVPDTEETESSLLPTLRAADSDKNQRTAEGCAKEASRKGANNDLAVAIGMLPTLSATELNGGGSNAETRKENGHHVRLRDCLKMLPSLPARDWKSEKSNITHNSRPLSEVVGKSSLKLTSSFCEAYQGFPIGWTEIDEPVSTHSETQSCRRKSSQSSAKSVI